MLRLEVEVMSIRTRPKPHLFQLRVVLAFSSFPFLLLLFVKILTEVHDLADRRIGIGRDFNKIQVLLPSQTESILDVIYTVITLRVYDAHMQGANVIVDTDSSVFCDGFASKKCNGLRMLVSPYSRGVVRPAIMSGVSIGVLFCALSCSPAW